VKQARYVRPTRLSEALAALADRPWSILAGGTAFYPGRLGNSFDEDVLNISAISDARAVTREDGHWRIPMLATWTDLIENHDLPARFDGLKKAARQVGGVQIQNAATICGNLCNASPTADAAPNLLALDALVELQSVRAERLLPVSDFITGDCRTARGFDELVTALIIPETDRRSRSTFLKLGARKYLVISIVTVGAVVELGTDQRIAAARFAIGACGPVAKRLPRLEERVLGQELRSDLADLVSDRHLAPLKPIDDVRGTAAYRRDAALTLLRRTLAELSR
jgi:CO/xanthine dehydrogenase FAD-binding subunit